MSQRIKWNCPRCAKAYAVPSTEGLTLCPSCKTASISEGWQPEIISGQSTRPKRKSELSFFVGFMVTSLIFISVTVYFVRNPPTFGVRDIQNAVGLSPERAVVRKWLKENLDDSTWEEVKWWPSIEGNLVKNERIAEAKKDVKQAIEELKRRSTDFENASARDNPFSATHSRDYVLCRQAQEEAYAALLIVDARLIHATEQKDGMIIRLKYRATSRVGAKVLFDKAFLLNDEGIIVEDTPCPMSAIWK